MADVRAARSGTDRLVAFLTGTKGHDFAALRDAIRAVAPAHLVPAIFVPVETIPLNPNGKIDRRALPDPWLGRDTAAPEVISGSTESVLCALVADLLDLDEVDAGDDFFGLGGDSIIAIQLTSRARELGVSVTPRQIFELRTVAAIATAAHTTDEETDERTNDPARAYGKIPLTPLMKRVVRTGHLEGFAQARVMRVPATIGSTELSEALAVLAAAHPILRARLHTDHIEVQPEAGGGGTTPIALRELRMPDDVSGDEAQAWITARVTETAHTIDPQTTDLARALLITGLADTPETNAFVLVIHHLAVDGVSWRILTEDLSAATAAVTQARAPHIRQGTTSFREWALGLEERAQDADLAASAAQWAHPHTSDDEVLLSSRLLDPAVDTAGRVKRIEIDIPADAVVSRLPALYRTGPTEVLLATLGLAVGTHFGNGRGRLFIDLEGHGRDETLVDGVDLSRTLGWFTAFWPVPVDLPHIGDQTISPSAPSLPAPQSIDSVIKQVKERLALPRFGGLEYGLLTELRSGATAQQASPVLFNYLGRMTTGEGDGPFSSLWPQRPLLVVRDDQMPVSHPLEVNAMTVSGDQGMVVRVEVSWVATLIDSDDVTTVVRAWSDILAMLDEPDVLATLGGTTPTDSLVADLTQDEIDEFANEFA